MEKSLKNPLNIYSLSLGSKTLKETIFLDSVKSEHFKVSTHYFYNEHYD